MPKDHLTLMHELRDYASPKARLTRMIKSGDVIQVRRGLFLEARETGHSLKSLASVIYGPSYISFEYALAHYGLIPERVQSVTSAVYNKNGKDIRLKGKVKAVISKAGALIKEETAQKLRDNETKEILKEKTLQTSDSLILSTLNGDYRAEGNVIVEQKNRIAKSDTAEY